MATPAEISTYRAMLAGMDEGAFLTEAERQIWLSEFANNNPRAPAHWKADAAHDEAQRRERPWLYQRAWNAAYRSCGYEPSEDDERRAKPPKDALRGDGEPPEAA